MKQLPKEITIEGQTWELMDPGLYMRNHIGEITTPDGTVFDISQSLNGLSLYLETPYDHPHPPEPEPSDLRGATPRQIVGKAMYKLAGGATLKALVQALVVLPEE